MKMLKEAGMLVLSFIAVALLSAFAAHFAGAAGVVVAAAAVGWASSDLSGQPVKRGQSSKVAGAQERAFAQSWSKVAGDGDGSIYYVAEIPASAVFIGIAINNVALAGATSWSLGFYKLNDDGTISDTAKSDGTSGAALLMSAQDLNAGKAIGSDQDGLADLGITNVGKKVWELLGFTDPKLKNDSYILGLKLTTAGAAAGGISVRGRFVQG